MRQWWLVLALVGCHEKNEHPTPVGTKVLDWKLADSDRTTIRNAKTENVKVQDIDWDAHPTDDTHVKLKLHVETAQVTYEEDGKQVVHDAAIAITATVVDNGDFTFLRPNCGGPHYQLAAPGEAPRVMITQCRISTHKPRYEVGFWFEVWGDGKVDDMVKK